MPRLLLLIIDMDYDWSLQGREVKAYAMQCCLNVYAFKVNSFYTMIMALLVRSRPICLKNNNNFKKSLQQSNTIRYVIIWD